MAEICWQGQGPEFALSWAGLNWRLKLDGPRPGLELSGSDRVLLLALDGLAVKGRACRWDSERPILSKVESLTDRIEATYAFPNWGGLSVRASWMLLREIEGVDLEVQLLADSVDFLKSVEVQVVTQIDNPRHQDSVYKLGDLLVEPRDRDSAMMSYDGRESAAILESLVTLPVPSRAQPRFKPRMVETTWIAEDLHYIELVHPDDVARRLEYRNSLTRPPASPLTLIRYGLFGHDLEKGVLLRSRMRGLWARGPVTDQDLEARYDAFRAGPLPLGL